MSAVGKSRIRVTHTRKQLFKVNKLEQEATRIQTSVRLTALFEISVLRDQNEFQKRRFTDRDVQWFYGLKAIFREAFPLLTSWGRLFINSITSCVGHLGWGLFKREFCVVAQGDWGNLVFCLIKITCTLRHGIALTKNLVKTKGTQLKIFDNVLSEIRQCDVNHRFDRQQIAIVVHPH